jgi:hypothetical protein
MPKVGTAVGVPGVILVVGEGVRVGGIVVGGVPVSAQIGVVVTTLVGMALSTQP